MNYDQQIEKLKNEKNLLIDNEAYEKEILKQTSYYSLIGGYKDIFKNPTTKKYKDGTRFEDIVELYYFDELLRQLFLRYLIKVENGIKSQVSYYFTEKNGENQRERLFTYRTADSIPDLPIHRKLKITQKGSQYVNGKNDLFSVVIALRYMLNDQWYKEFIKELKTLIDKYLKKNDSISEQELYEKMGFPENWRKITRYRKQ